jgi:hypothetical protein
MRILVAGDTHGNFPHLQYLIREAKKADCDTIVQVGDFGFTWPGKKVFDAVLQPYLAKHGITLYWVDGNHDNYTDLQHRGIWESDKPEPMSNNVTYLPRACRWEWDGVSFMSLGGGISIDKDRRVTGLSWWREESLSYGQIQRAIDGGPVDVMLTHDCPAGVRPLEKFLQTETARFGVPYKTEFASTMHRKALGEATAVAQPRLLVHGHYHHRYLAEAPWDADARVLGLGRDTMGPASWVVLDTEGFDGRGQSLFTEHPVAKEGGHLA